MLNQLQPAAVAGGPDEDGALALAAARDAVLERPEGELARTVHGLAVVVRPPVEEADAVDAVVVRALDGADQCQQVEQQHAL